MTRWGWTPPPPDDGDDGWTASDAPLVDVAVRAVALLAAALSTEQAADGTLAKADKYARWVRTGTVG